MRPRRDVTAAIQRITLPYPPAPTPRGTQRFNQGGRPDLDWRPYSCATVPDSHRLRLSALPSGAWAPWLRASKSTCHWQTQPLACGKHTTIGPRTQQSSVGLMTVEPFWCGVAQCSTIARCALSSRLLPEGTLAQAMDKPGWNAYYALGICHCTPPGRTVS